MTETEKIPLIPELPDEGEYPAALRQGYELLECFSEKADTRTLLASDKQSGERYVVKCYLPSHPLFAREEPAALRELRAEGLPRFHAEFKNDSMRCVLRDYVPGDTLFTLSERKQFTAEEVLAIGVQLCEELDVLHGMTPPIIHRDIKPQNVVIRPDGAAVLIDFGIARVHSDNETDTVAFGTQGFAPPEQYGFSQTDARSDIYSLGVLLYWLLHHETKLTAKARTPLEKVIARCCCFDPAGRFADVRQLRRALLAARPEAQRKRRITLTAAALLVLVLAVVGSAFAVRASDRSVSFAQPLIEQAVRLNLGLDDKSAVTRDMLAQVKGVYIVADTAYPDADSFYPAISRWYAEGRSVRGGITELSDLGMLPELEQVCIVAQELENIRALAACPKLDKVELKHNYITDISVLAGMDRLRSVGINDNPVRDISPLTDCPNLAFLDLCDVRSYDSAVIARLGNFDFLDISNPTESYRYLDGKSILDLRIAWTGLDDLHVLDRVTRLERLEIDHTAVSDLSPLLLHSGLKVLRLSALLVTDLSVLKELPQLEEVTLSADMKSAADALGEVPFSILFE